MQVEDLINQYEGFVFDMDGTLVDSMPLHLAGWQHAAKIFQFNFSAQWFYDLGGVPSRKIAALVEQDQKIALDLDAVTQTKSDYFLSVIHQVEAFPAMKQLVEQLSVKRALSIGTGSIRKNAERMLKHSGLYEYFPVLTTADDVVHHKPNPDTFLLSAAKMNIKPSDCLVFEDTTIGMEAAKNAGMDCVLIIDGKPDWTTFRTHR